MAAKLEMSTLRWAAILLLINFANLLIFTVRFLPLAHLSNLKLAYAASDFDIALVHMAFELSKVLFSVIFGFLGDRHNRCHLVVVSLLITAPSCFFISHDSFGWFLAVRCLQSLADAAGSTMLPALIGDLRTGKSRTFALSLYHFGNPIGCGLSFVLAAVFPSFHTAFALPAFAMIICAIAFALIVPDPERGAAETKLGHHEPTSRIEDIRQLVHAPSFVLSAIGHAFSSFASAGVWFWAPGILNLATTSKITPIELGWEPNWHVGLVAALAGILGISIGATISSTFLKTKVGLKADGLLYGTALVVASIAMFSWLATEGTRISVFLLCFAWIGFSCSLVHRSELTMQIASPTRRVAAEAIQNAFSNLLSAFGPMSVTWLCSALDATMAPPQPPPLAGTVILMSLTISLHVLANLILISGVVIIGASLFLVESDATRAFVSPTVSDTQHSEPHNFVATTHSDDDDVIFFSDSQTPQPSQITIMPSSLSMPLSSEIL